MNVSCGAGTRPAPNDGSYPPPQRTSVYIFITNYNELRKSKPQFYCKENRNKDTGFKPDNRKHQPVSGAPLEPAWLRTADVQKPKDSPDDREQAWLCDECQKIRPVPKEKLWGQRPPNLPVKLNKNVRRTLYQLSQMNPLRTNKETHCFIHSSKRLFLQYYLTSKRQGWNSGAAVKGSHFPCRGPEFGSWHSHAGSHPPPTPVPGDLAPSSGLCEHQARACADIHGGKALVHIK